MRKLTPMLAGFAALCLASAVLAQRQEIDDMTVTAVVETYCQIGCVDTLAFGTYAQQSKTAEAGIEVTCVESDSKARLSLGDGLHLQAVESSQLRRMKRIGGDSRYLAYVLKVDNVDGPCWGGANVCPSPYEVEVTQNSSQQSFEVHGEIPADQPLFVGSYSDTVIVTVTF